MRAHFRNISLITLGLSVALGACTIIEDPVRPMTPNDRRDPAPQPAQPAPAQPAATPAPGAANPAPPVVTPVPGTAAQPTPPVATTTPVKPGTPVQPSTPGTQPGLPAEPPAVGPATRKPPKMRIPRLLPKRTPPVGPPEQTKPPTPSQKGREDGAACSTSAQCASGTCEGMGCGYDQGKCVPAQRSCTRDLRLFCGCDGKEFRASGSCPGRVFLHAGACRERK